MGTLVAGQEVTVLWDSKDRYGRVLGWVLNEEGTEVCLEMVAQGFGLVVPEVCAGGDGAREG